MTRWFFMSKKKLGGRTMKITQGHVATWPCVRFYGWALWPTKRGFVEPVPLDRLVLLWLRPALAHCQFSLSSTVNSPNKRTGTRRSFTARMKMPAGMPGSFLTGIALFVACNNCLQTRPTGLNAQSHAWPSVLSTGWIANVLGCRGQAPL